MKIELEEPYKSDWKHGYIVTNRENRKHVILYNSPKDRSTVSYARYLMACSLGKYIDDGFEVDHIDNDKTNDVLSNLQILSKKENLNKSNPAYCLTKQNGWVKMGNYILRWNTTWYAGETLLISLHKMKTVDK